MTQVDSTEVFSVVCVSACQFIQENCATHLSPRQIENGSDFQRSAKQKRTKTYKMLNMTYWWLFFNLDREK